MRCPLCNCELNSALVGVKYLNEMSMHDNLSYPLDYILWKCEDCEKTLKISQIFSYEIVGVSEEDDN